MIADVVGKKSSEENTSFTNASFRGSSTIASKAPVPRRPTSDLWKPLLGSRTGQYAATA